MPTSGRNDRWAVTREDGPIRLYLLCGRKLVRTRWTTRLYGIRWFKSLEAAQKEIVGHPWRKVLTREEVLSHLVGEAVAE